MNAETDAAPRLAHRENPWRNRQLYGLLFLVSFLFLAAAIDRSTEVYDEGIILTGASRVLAGALPHRDFYANYGPGQFYLVAGVFKLFGPSVLVERVLDLMVKAAIMCLVFSVSREVIGRKAAAFASLLTILWIAAWGSPGYPVWASMLFMLLGVKTIFPVLENRSSTRSLAVSGVFVGLIVLFRYDVGFFVCAAMSLVLAAYGLMEYRASSRTTSIFSMIAPFWIGIAAVCVPLFTSFAFAGMLHDFIFQVIQFPSRFYARTRSLPFPLLSHPLSDLATRGPDIIVYVPPLAILTAIVFFAFSRPKSDGLSTAPINQWGWKIGLLSSLAFALYFKGIVRVSSLHMSLSLVPSFIVLVALIARLANKTAARPASQFVNLVAGLSLVWMVAASSFAVFISGFEIARNGYDALKGEFFRLPQSSVPAIGWRGSCIQPSGLDRIHCFRIEDEEAQAIQFIRQNTADGEPIYVGTGRHDKVFINDIEFYFLADRAPATKWYQFDPGLQTSQPIQESIVAQLKRNNVRYVVIWNKFINRMEPNDSAKSSGVFILDDYINTHYTIVRSFGDYSILAKNSWQRIPGKEFLTILPNRMPLQPRSACTSVLPRSPRRTRRYYFTPKSKRAAHGGPLRSSDRVV